MARISKLPVIEDVERLSLEFERSSLPKFRALLKSYIRFPNIGSANNPVPRIPEVSINAICVLRRLRETAMFTQLFGFWFGGTIGTPGTMSGRWFALESPNGT